MKKIVCLLLVSIFLITACDKKEMVENPKTEGVNLMEFGEFKNITPDKTTSIIVLKYTEGGVSENEITSSEEIANTYNYLNNYKVGDKVDMACDDNTTIYKFNLDDGSNLSIEIECNWIVVGKNRYEIK